ncbi:MAG: two-component regulator propeller domain-containing protein [Bacteroidota bacterium]
MNGRQHILRFLLILFFYAGVANLFAQQYNIRNYSDPQQVGQSQVYALLEDSRSYIWMGTWGGGLTRYDGLNFQNFTREDGLLSNYIQALHEDGQQQIWIGTDRGLCRYDGRQFQTISFADGANRAVNSITHAPNGELWIGTLQGLYQLRDSLLHPIDIRPLPSNTPVRSCLMDRYKRLWIATNQGVMRIDDSGRRLFGLEEGLTSLDVQGLLEDRQGHIWMATGSSGINIFDGARIARFEGSNEIEESGLANCLFESKEGNIWVGTQLKGAYVWSRADSSYSYLGQTEGLESNSVKAIIEDRWGHIWLGTSGGGVSCYFGRQFLHYELRDGLLDEHIYALHRDSADRLLLGTGRGLTQLDKGQLRHFNASNGFKNIKIKALHRDYEGQLWIGTEGQGLAIQDSRGYRWLRGWDGLRGDIVQDFAQDTAGHIWVAMADAGICELIPNPADSLGVGYRFQHYGQQIKESYVSKLLIDEQFRLWWAGRRRGIGYITEDSLRTFGRADGLKDLDVRSLVEDRYGNLWGGTGRAGIFRMNIYAEQPQIEHFGRTDGLTSNNIYLLAFDNEGYLWVGNNKGVDRLQLDAEQNIIAVRHFGRNEGFKGGETCTNAVVNDAQGGLWFGTLNGLTHYIPGSNRQNTGSPALHFTQINLFYESLETTPYAEWALPWGGLRPGMTLPHGQNHLGFNFIGINYSNPEAVRYQWRMKGLEEGWSPLSNQRNVTYSNIPPGDYTFLLRAYNEDGFGTAPPLQVSFAIRPPLWETWWFQLTAGLLLVLLTTALLRARINRIKRRAKREREQLELEKKLLQLEQKALQLQMNPHFIFNALNSIQGLIGQQDHRKARYQLAKFSRLMRATLENSREGLISLEEEIETLRDYLALEQFSRGHSFDFDIQTAEGLDTELVQMPPMMIQPFVENAIIHGLGRRSEGGKIALRFTRNNGQLECSVTDNGIGRAAARQRKSQQEQQHKSMALQVTQERLDLLGGGAGKRKSLEIIDLQENGEAKGTKVLLRLPYVEA